MKFPRFRANQNSAANGSRVDADGAPALDLNPLGLLSRRHNLNGHKSRLSERPHLNIVILGQSIAVSSTDGHAATYRGFVRELSARGHNVLFLERDSGEHAADSNLPNLACGRTEFYVNFKELKSRFAAAIRDADFVLLGSGLQDGIAIADWITRTAQGPAAFYDTDTSATLAELGKGEGDFISAALIPRFQLYLSITGGSTLEYIEEKFRSPRARTLHSFVDASLYFPEHREIKWDCGYLGNYSDDRQPTLERLFLEPARRWNGGRFVIAGAQYPRSVRWARNVKRLAPVPSGKERAFYNSQRFTLNLTSASMAASGFSPTMQLFEAAACGTPIISDYWPGIETFFKPDEEILISHSPDETLVYLEEISELERRRIAYRARERVLSGHTARHRAAELESYILEIVNPVFA